MRKVALSHLRRNSPYASIGYFVFLCLHRMGRTTDALIAARDNLRGEKVCGWSNVLGVFSGLISHEHGKVPVELLRQVLKDLPEEIGDFRIKEKLKLALLMRLDGSRTAETQAPSAAPSNVVDVDKAGDAAVVAKPTT